jgi:thymidylate synthase (FAD)
MDVVLIDVMGTESSIVQAARVSYGAGTKTVSEDTALIRYLMRHWHTTPFEMVEFKFRINCPIFVARQLMRHRTASINEYSARYSVVKNEFWTPVMFRGQSKTNTQGSEGFFTDQNLLNEYVDACENSFKVYEKMLNAGVSREIARAVLPQSTFTEFYWKIDLHNLLHFLRLRMDSHAQPEIQEVAVLIWNHVKEKFPNVAQAFLDYRVESITFSGPEIRGDPLSKGEQREYDSKMQGTRWNRGSQV